MTTRKPPLRFVPTLTEVVQSPGVPMGGSAYQSEQLRLALQELAPILEAELRNALQEVVKKQLNAFETQLQSQVDKTVKLTISQFMESFGSRPR
jgi:hypothetical protein